MRIEQIQFDSNRKKLAGKWKSAIMLILFAKAQRFNKIKQLLNGISPTQLTKCLKELEENGIIFKKENSHVTYHLTKDGKEICTLFIKIKEILDRLP